MRDIQKTHPFYKSLDASWKEGIPANIMIFITDYYLIPFALFLGAQGHEIGFLVAIPHLLGSLAQIASTRMVKAFGSRLRLLIAGALMQSLCLLFLSGFAFFKQHFVIYLMVLIVCVFRIAGNFIGTSWGSLMSEYLSPEERGGFLGWRSQVVSLTGIFGMIGAGVWLHFAEQRFLAFGFFLLIFTAFSCRLISAFMFREMADLPYKESTKDHFTFFMFIRKFRSSNFVRFVLYVTSITFATQLAAPFFHVYMLKDLGLNYFQYSAIDLAMIVAGMISFPLWGRHADRVGNAKILKITSLLIPLIPILWIFSGNVYYLLFVEAFSGFVWGGFNLCAANYIYDAVKPEKRVRCLSYFNLINGICIFFGASLGGFLSERLPQIFGHSLLCLFLISGLMRAGAHFLLSGSFRETRPRVENINSLRLFFSVIGLRPMGGRNKEIINWPPLYTAGDNVQDGQKA